MSEQGREGGIRAVRVLSWSTLEGETRYFELPERDVAIGRSPGLDLSFAFGDVSRRQCTLLRRDRQWSLRDDGSTGGTFVNGHRLEGERVLEAGDAIRLGEFGQVELECRAAAEIELPRGEGGGEPSRDEVMLTVLSALSSTLDLEEVLALVLDSVLKLGGLQRGEALLIPAAGAPGTRRSRGECSEGARQAGRRAIATGAPVVQRSPEGLDIVALPMRAYEGNRLAMQRETGAVRAVGVLVAEGTNTRLGEASGTIALMQAACDIAAVHVAHARLFEKVRHDSLTGLLNRGSFDQDLARHVGRAVRHSLDLSLALLDIDHFKSINDTHGHPVGDEALKAVARELRRVVGERGVVFRYGGEEMAVLVPGEGLEAAAGIIEEARRAVEEHPIRASGTQGEVELHLTFSAGVAQWSSERHRVAGDLTKEADDRCLAAKNIGRNRVVTSGGAPPPS